MSDNFRQTNDIFSRCITHFLAQTGELPHALTQLIQQSATRLLDSEMIIEDTFVPMADLTSPRVEQPLESFEQTIVIDELTDAVKTTGFGEHFHQIIGLFGSIMLGLCATDEQQKKVNKWLEEGYFGHFLMTDGGGPVLAGWNSVFALGEDGQNATLSVDKKWGIEAQNLGFSMIVCQQRGKPFPLTVLLSPEKSAALEQSNCGGAYLDGKLQLGNAKGEVEVSKADLLSKGGLGSVNRFLTLVRPRFVKCLMHHLLWLESNERLTLDEDDHRILQFIVNAADWCTAQTTFSIHSVDRVLALKFTSNEFLLNLVAKQALPQLSDQRDLLGFTKMEGSSYRCLFEVYSKFKRSRR